MPQILYTSDQHFGHANLILGSMRTLRPFASVEEHDETLIAAWNSVVRPADEVWHLGDFAYRCTQEHAQRCFDRLNGRKRLIRGNHDLLAERVPWHGPILDVAHVHGLDPVSNHEGRRLRVPQAP
ncbi:metallophosphoesterase [Methylobacterium sp. B1]|uniref:metallophosphoesterase n=1 Tax=Methylobacterium sp. B1 TaxID=91459 RepID=UPI00034A2DBE|nr:metallophosphoesterase [Methylobacterium sp. B1]